MNVCHNVFSGNFDCVVSSNDTEGSHKKSFLNGIENARNLLSRLEHSLRKTRKYEKQLVKCKSTHSHTHSPSEWWDSELSQSSRASRKDTKFSNADTMKSSRSHQVDLAESWSTMSIVCLQYQYEELSKRYNSLLQAYDERCKALNSRDAALSRLRQRARMTRDKLEHAHRALLSVGEKFMTLRERRLEQKRRYEEKIVELKNRIRDVMTVAERARLDLDSQIADTLLAEKDSAAAMLLAEIRKCNLLFLENLRLKALVDEFAPGKVEWDAYYLENL